MSPPGPALAIMAVIPPTTEAALHSRRSPSTSWFRLFLDKLFGWQVAFHNWDLGSLEAAMDSVSEQRITPTMTLSGLEL